MSSNKVKSKEERQHPLVKQKLEKKRAEGRISDRLKSAQAQRLAARETQIKGRKKNKAVNFTKDLWDDDEPIPKEFQVEWYNKNLIDHNLKSVGKPKVRLPGEVHSKRSALKAVQAPHPGISYNPTFDDHQELVEEVVKKEVKLIKREEHLERVTTKKFSKMSSNQIEKMKQTELIQGLPIDKSKENRKVEEPSDDEYKTVNPPVRNKKKDRQTRRKQKEAKERRALEDIKKQELKKVKDINTLGKIKKEIVTIEKTVEKKRKNQDQRLREKKISAGRLSRKKYIDPEIEFNQLEDISGNLRSLKPEGNLLLDRFKSLQKRNILPSGVLRKVRRKTLVKKYIKKSHKAEGITTKNKIKPPKTSR